MQHVWAAGVAALAAWLGCYSPDFREGRPCAPDEGCPDGQYCVIGTCTSQPPVDAPPPDGPPCRPTEPPTYMSNPMPAQNCGDGVVSYAISSWTFSEPDPGQLQISPAIAHFPPLLGTLNPFDCTGAFSATSQILGSCCETYVLTGTFTDERSWSGSFAAQFCDSPSCGCATGDGVSCAASACSNQNVQLVGTRSP